MQNDINHPQKRHDRPINPTLVGRQPSATLAINHICQRMKTLGQEIYNFGLGQSPFPIPSIIVKELQKHAYQKDYLPVKGLLPLREAVARFHQRHDGLAISADNIIIGPGSKELLFLLQLSFEGDLLLANPSWVSYAPQAQIIGRTIHWLPTDAPELQLTASALEAFCEQNPKKSRLLILNYPCNPTGSAFSEQQLQQIANVARKYHIIILSDEIYSRLNYDGSHVSIARFYPENTIISGGISKWLGAGGWRLGTLAFPPNLQWLLDAVSAAASETYSSTSAPIQHASIKAFSEDPEITVYVSRCCRLLKALCHEVQKRLHAHHITLPSPKGAFYLFPNFDHWRFALRSIGIKTSIDLCRVLLEETKVAILPGSDFGRPQSELSTRWSLVDFDGGTALQEVSLLNDNDDIPLEVLTRCCGTVLQGVDKVCEWLSSLELTHQP